MPDIATKNLYHVIDELESLVEKISEPRQLLRDINPIFKEILTDEELMNRILSHLYSNNEFINGNINLINRNEVVFFRSSKSGFSLRLFIWEPETYSIIHDHGSWGVIGASLSRLQIENYQRNDDSSQPEYADLSVSERMILEHGESTGTLPFNLGIHQVGNPDKKSAISISLYGKALRKGYIYGFVPEEKKAFRLFPPKLEKRLLALKALEDLGWKAPGSLFSEALRESRPVVCRPGVLNKKK